MELVIDNSVQASKPQLEGFKIHNVEFKGVEKTDITSPKDGTIYKVIVIKFENEFGTNRTTIFEPKDADYTRQPSQFGGLNPSRIDIILDLFKQLITAVNPVMAKEMAEGKQLKLSGATYGAIWDSLRVAFVENTKDYVGTKTQIKLEKNKKGEAQFPGFPMGIDREGVLYRSSTYIGNNIGWTPKETKAMTNYVQASATPMKKLPSIDLDLTASVPAKSSTDGLNLAVSMDDLS